MTLSRRKGISLFRKVWVYIEDRYEVILYLLNHPFEPRVVFVMVCQHLNEGRINPVSVISYTGNL